MILSRDLLTRTDSYYSSLRLSDISSVDVTPYNNQDSAIIPDHVPFESI